MPGRRGPHIYTREGRPGFWAYLDRKHFHIPIGADEAEAKVRFAELLKRHRILELAPGQVALSKLADQLTKRSETANTEKTAYELFLNLRRVVKWLEDRGVHTARQVTKETVEDYKTARRFAASSRSPDQKVSAARVNRELDSLRRLLTYAIERKQAAPWALEAVVKLREPRPEPHQRTVSKADFARFLAEAPATYRPLFRAAIGCGLRDDELRHVALEDIRGGEVAVTPKPGWSTKGYRYRHVPITAATARALRSWVKARDAGKVNTDPKRIWTIMHDACTTVGVEPFSLHDLRRAWATHLFSSRQVSLKELSMLLGHREVATTERYLRLDGRVQVDRTKLPW